MKKESKNRQEGVAHISATIREARLRWLGHVERKTEEGVAMRTCTMEVNAER